MKNIKSSNVAVSKFLASLVCLLILGVTNAALAVDVTNTTELNNALTGGQTEITVAVPEGITLTTNI